MINKDDDPSLIEDDLVMVSSNFIHRSIDNIRKNHFGFLQYLSATALTYTWHACSAINA